MCGIIGLISGDDCLGTALHKLKNLEYRGYDSAGVCFDREGLYCVKSLGVVDNLISKCINQHSSRVIAHTRWATHGKPNIRNSHPQFNENRSLAIVHNGIIENYKELKTERADMGTVFRSDTDTEVIANIIGSYDSEMDGMMACHRVLKGSYAVVCMCEGGDSLIATKVDCPLYVAKTNVGVMICSDTVCFDNGQEYYTLNNGEIVRATADEIHFLDHNGMEIDKPTRVLNNNDIVKPTGLGHHMLAEIYETVDRLKNMVDSCSLFNIDLRQYTRVYIVGCGSAYNAGLIMKYYLSLQGIECVVERASEFVYNKYSFKSSICIFISQSGETADTISACRRAKSEGAKTISITNVPVSLLSTISDKDIPLGAGREIAVASTKAYSCQIMAGYLLANANIDLEHIKSDIDKINDIDVESIRCVAQRIKSLDKLIFLGRSVDYSVVIEGSLKLKEVSYINCSSYPSGELKHGPLALIEKGDYCIMCVTQGHLLDKAIVCINEIHARGGNLVILSQFDVLKEYCRVDDMFVRLPKARDDLMPFVSTVAMQYMAYFTSIARGINPDRPRNLAKSVTVE